MLSSVSSSSHGWWCGWCVRAKDGLYFATPPAPPCVQVRVQGRDVFSHFAIVGYGLIAKRVAQLQTLIGLRDLVNWSPQMFVFPIEFVDQNQFLGNLHYFRRSRLASTPSIGGSRAVRKPPFCKMRRLFCNAVFLVDNSLKSFWLRRSFIF